MMPDPNALTDARRHALRIEAQLQAELSTLPPNVRREVARLVQNWLNRWARALALADLRTNVDKGE
jgi:hypothetical protein